MGGGPWGRVRTALCSALSPSEQEADSSFVPTNDDPPAGFCCCRSVPAAQRTRTANPWVAADGALNRTPT